MRSPAKWEWRCTYCHQLLGVLQDGRLQLRFSRGHEYLVGLPATTVCRGCQTLNEFKDPRREASVSA